MRVWIVEAGEPLPSVDEGARPWRCGMLSDALLARGHEVRWWASTFDHARKRFRFSEARTIETRPGLTIRLLHGPGYRRNVGRARWRSQVAIARAFEREAPAAPVPDLIFCCLPTPDLAERATRIGLAIGRPVIIDVRDLWPDLYLTPFPPLVRPAVRLALATEFARTKRALRDASGITAVSDSFMKWALAHAGRGACATDGVFPLGYLSASVPSSAGATDGLTLTPPLEPDSLVVTFVGTFGASYDLETVVDAARELHRSGDTRVRFVLAGDGDKAADLRARAGDLPNVTFAGWLDQNGTASLLRQSSVGLCAYASGALQSLPNKPFEYMAAGLPLLSSLEGELEAMIRAERIGVQYKARNIQSLVAAVRSMVANPVARAEMGREARQIFEARFRADVVYPALTRHLEHAAKSM